MFLANFNNFMRLGMKKSLYCQGFFRTSTCSRKLHSQSPLNCGILLKPAANYRTFCKSAEMKRVTIIFKKWDGDIVKRRGFVGETIQDIVPIDDPDIPGYGCCCGTLSCSTCHIILKPEDYERLSDKASDEEMDLISYAPGNCETSRLGCAMEISEEMDGIVIQVPAITRDQRDEFDR